MAKTKILEYSATAASNTDIDSINLSEGVMVPSDLNNAIREQMAHLKDFSDGTSGIDVLSLTDNTDTNQLKFQAPASVTTTTTFTLPDGDGSNGQVLSTDGSGTLSWTTAVNFGDWSIAMDGSNNLLFSYNGTGMMKISSTGDLTVAGDVTAYGTV